LAGQALGVIRGGRLPARVGEGRRSPRLRRGPDDHRDWGARPWKRAPNRRRASRGSTVAPNRHVAQFHQPTLRPSPRSQAAI